MPVARFQSCFVERGNGFVLGTKLWTVVLSATLAKPSAMASPRSLKWA